ncbi:MAG: phosphatidate cytidylyltransferase, partial [Spirochaetia bacterium]|nr:phosphatidate cytidylyltransferase [Spirochaetia bacterium]
TVTGILIAFSSIVGDLAESVFKRSADVKDSGHIIPGRGGVLDSIDSIVMSAPVFYLLFSIFFGPFN